MGSYETPARKPWIETPLIESAALSKAAGCRIFLKLDLLQPSGSFKSRGIGNLILSHLSDPANKGKKLRFYSSSGGNAGLAAVTAARDLGAPCTVVVPTPTNPMMINKLRAAGAYDVLQHGASWMEADTYMRDKFLNNQNGDNTSSGDVRNIHIPPFDHPEIWNGASTLVSELAHQLPPREQKQQESPDQESPSQFPADAIICSVGGGGLFNGIVQGLADYHAKSSKFNNDNNNNSDNISNTTKPTQVVAVETIGADSLSHSLRQGSLQRIPAITSLATSLGALVVSEKTFQNAISPPAGVDVSNVVVSDASAAKGVISLLDETRLLVELASAVCVNVAIGDGDGGKTPLKDAVKDLRPESRVVIVVCGGSNVTAEKVVEWRKMLADGWE